MKTTAEKIATTEGFKMLNTIESWLIHRDMANNRLTDDEVIDEAKIIIDRVKVLANMERTREEKDEVRRIAIKLRMIE